MIFILTIKNGPWLRTPHWQNPLKKWPQIKLKQLMVPELKLKIIGFPFVSAASVGFRGNEWN